MEQGRLERLAPLTGVVFFLLIVAALVVNSSSSPDVGDSAQKITGYYTSHRNDIRAGDIIGVFAGLFVLWFAASLRSAIWRVEGGSGRLASLVLAGGILVAGGAWVIFGLDFALADSVTKVPPQAAQTLSVLSNDLFFPLLGGFGVLMLASGLGLIRTRALPVALGWIALVLGVVCFTPIGFFALLAAIIWIPITAVFLYLRGGQPAAGAPAVVTTAPAA